MAATGRCLALKYRLYAAGTRYVCIGRALACSTAVALTKRLHCTRAAMAARARLLGLKRFPRGHEIEQSALVLRQPINFGLDIPAGARIPQGFVRNLGTATRIQSPDRALVL